jgi:hypothetical protein
VLTHWDLAYQGQLLGEDLALHHLLRPSCVVGHEDVLDPSEVLGAGGVFALGAHLLIHL